MRHHAGALRKYDAPEVAFDSVVRLASEDAPDQDLFARILQAALSQAERLRCHVDDYLLRSGLMPEAQFYETLAARLGVPFIPFPVLLDPTISPDDAMMSGLAPVDPRRSSVPPDTPVFIYAPQGIRLDWFIIHDSHALSFPKARIGITTPTAFRASLRATFGTRIAEQAKTKLVRQCRRASASALRSTLWIAILFGFVILIITSAVLTTSIWHGALLALSCFPILPGLLIKIMAFRKRRPIEITSEILADEYLPRYSVLVPVYREAAILKQLVTSLTALDYPRAKLDIKLIIEADDVETLDALSRIHLPPWFDVILCPRGSPRTKPRALTIGLAYSSSDLVVVYDAEDIPEPDQLKKAASIFASSDKKLACLQARLAIDNLDDSWFTRQFAFEYASLFDVLLPGLAALDQPIPLGGTSNHFRRRALDAIGAWDPWNVTEDADLGLRLYRAGYQVKTFDSTTYEEAPATYRSWLNQRMRWLKGWMQTAAVHMRSHHERNSAVTRAKWFALLLAACLSPVCILLHPALLLCLDYGIDAIADNPSEPFASNLLRGGFAAMFLCSLYLDMRIAQQASEIRSVRIRVRDLLGLIPYSLLKTYAGWRALLELLHAPYHWRKTPHGLARTSRLTSQQVTKKAS